MACSLNIKAPRPTTKTGMLLNALEKHSDCLFSSESIKNIQFPVSIRGNIVGGGTESASTLYHADVADLLYVIEHLLYNKTFQGPLQVKGMRFCYAPGTPKDIDSEKTTTDVLIPPNQHLHAISTYIFAIEDENTGELDLNTRMVIDYFSPNRFKTGEYLFTKVGDEYRNLITRFRYPVGIGFPGLRCHYIFEFFDVLSAILTHPSAKDRHPTSRNRQFTIKDLIPIRKGLSRKDYIEYIQLFQLLRSISNGHSAYRKPRRILVGQHCEWIAVSNKAYRDELSYYLASQSGSSLQESDWTTKVPNGDIHRDTPEEIQRQLVELKALLKDLKFADDAFIVDEEQNIHFDTHSETVFMQWASHKVSEYAVFMQKLSNIFKTPLLLRVLENHSHGSSRDQAPPTFLDLTQESSVIPSRPAADIEGTAMQHIGSAATEAQENTGIDIVPLDSHYLDSKSV